MRSIPNSLRSPTDTKSTNWPVTAQIITKTTTSFRTAGFVNIGLLSPTVGEDWHEARNGRNLLPQNPPHSRGPESRRAHEARPVQRQFARGALAPGIEILSIARGNTKTALSAGLALGTLLGTWDRQPRREILITAKTRD